MYFMTGPANRLYQIFNAVLFLSVDASNTKVLIDKDIARTPFFGTEDAYTTFVAKINAMSEAEVAIYLQGDWQAGGLINFLLSNGNGDYNIFATPEETVESIQKNVATHMFSYLDTDGTLSGLAYRTRKDDPSKWALMLCKNSSGLAEHKQVFILTSLDLACYVKQDYANQADVVVNTASDGAAFLKALKAPFVQTVVKTLLSKRAMKEPGYAPRVMAMFESVLAYPSDRAQNYHQLMQYIMQHPKKFFDNHVLKMHFSLQTESSLDEDMIASCVYQKGAFYQQSHYFYRKHRKSDLNQSLASTFSLYHLLITWGWSPKQALMQARTYTQQMAAVMPKCSDFEPSQARKYAVSFRASCRYIAFLKQKLGNNLPVYIKMILWGISFNDLKLDFNFDALHRHLNAEPWVFPKDKKAFEWATILLMRHSDTFNTPNSRRRLFNQLKSHPELAVYESSFIFKTSAESQQNMARVIEAFSHATVTQRQLITDCFLLYKDMTPELFKDVHGFLPDFIAQVPEKGTFSFYQQLGVLNQLRKKHAAVLALFNAFSVSYYHQFTPLMCDRSQPTTALFYEITDAHPLESKEVVQLLASVIMTADFTGLDANQQVNNLITEDIKARVIAARKAVLLQRLEGCDYYAATAEAFSNDNQLFEALNTIECQLEKIRAKFSHKKDYAALEMAYRNTVVKLIHTKPAELRKALKEAQAPLDELINVSNHPWAARAFAIIVNTVTYLCTRKNKAHEHATGDYWFFTRTKSSENLRDAVSRAIPAV